ncbi:MAG TPA: hypothetical protein VGM92_08420 [Candidatus Kapabacteria bacterium]|jgi:hypothetical protein
MRFVKLLSLSLACWLISCSQQEVSISGSGVTDISPYFWSASEPADSLYAMDSTKGFFGLSYSAGIGDTVIVRYSAAPPIRCSVSPDSVVAINLLPDGLFSHSYREYFAPIDTQSTLSGQSKLDSNGGLILLRSNPFSSDSTWDAGTLIASEKNSWRITARAIEHLDSLILYPKVIEHSYSDVIEVRYANERTDKTPRSDSLPYWIVYYAKSTGPVLIQNFQPSVSDFANHSFPSLLELGP